MVFQSRFSLFTAALFCALAAAPAAAAEKPLLPDILPVTSPKTPAVSKPAAPTAPRAAVPVTAPATAPMAAPANDPCATHADYAACKAYMAKIQRMIDARSQREKNTEEPAEAATAPAGKTPAPETAAPAPGAPTTPAEDAAAENKDQDIP